MTRQPPESREVNLGPGVPRVTLEPLDLPAAEFAAPVERCPVCRGAGRGKGSDEYGWYKCEGCGDGGGAR